MAVHRGQGDFLKTSWQRRKGAMFGSWLGWLGKQLLLLLHYYHSRVALKGLKPARYSASGCFVWKEKWSNVRPYITFVGISEWLGWLVRGQEKDWKFDSKEAYRKSIWIDRSIAYWRKTKILWLAHKLSRDFTLACLFSLLTSSLITIAYHPALLTYILHPLVLENAIFIHTVMSLLVFTWNCWTFNIWLIIAFSTNLPWWCFLSPLNYPHG